MNSPPWYPGANGGVSFGSTAPSNPVRGHMWWDGHAMWLFDGAAWVDFGVAGISGESPPVGGGGGGGAVGTTTETFAIAIASNLAITADGNWHQVPFNTVPQVDTQGAWDPITYKIKPTVAGYYMFMNRQYFSLTGAGSMGIMMLKNDSGVIGGSNDTIVMVQDQYYATTTSGWVSSSGIIRMNGTTDFVRCWAVSSQGTLYANPNPACTGFLLP
jgi:hypothetical protein